MADADFAAPARKSFRGNKGKGRGRGAVRRKNIPSGKQLHKDSEQTIEPSLQSSVAPDSLKGKEANAEPKGEGAGEGASDGQHDLDLEKLLEQVSNDHWYTLPGHNSESFQWPHLDQVPLGFELEALQIGLPKDLFELDLGALETSLSGLPAHELAGGLERSVLLCQDDRQEEATMNQTQKEAREIAGEEPAGTPSSSGVRVSALDSNKSSLTHNPPTSSKARSLSFDQKQASNQSEQVEQDELRMGKGSDDECELDELLNLSLEDEKNIPERSTAEDFQGEDNLLVVDGEGEVEDEDAELDALLGM